MKAQCYVSAGVATLLLVVVAAGEPPTNPGNSSISPTPPAGQAPGQQPGGSPSPYEDFDKVVSDAARFEGVFRLYLKKDRLLLEIEQKHFDKNYLLACAIKRGIGTGFALGGMTLDERLIAFRRVGDKVHLVHRNTRFRAQPGTPAAEAVKNAFTDSVLAALRIISARPSGSVLVDITDVLMADLFEVRGLLASASQGGFYRLDPSRSSFGKIKNFPMNAEIELNATFASDGGRGIYTVPDPRSVSLTLQYSLCALPETGYRPRLADDRVGYFLTVVKDFSRPNDETAFVRYINRWHLEKADPNARLSPPKKPIIFWIEKTVPYEYRKYVREGILEWNKAFEKIGFVDAIEVRMQPDDEDWDPEDVRYSTFRWITPSSGGFAIGPSRVNPLTGQIFDADILFDADFIRAWQFEYDLFHEDKAALAVGWNDHAPDRCRCCMLSTGRGLDIAFGSAAIFLRDQAPGHKVPEELIGQGLKEVVMHEVGHTLGLRHNFKASTLWKMEELHDTSKTREKGLSSSVMDYNPVNIAPKGVKQGDYFSTTIGPYDYWAIEYGYKPISAPNPEGERAELNKIASRSGERELAYATDEDTRSDQFGRSWDPDPLVNRFDFGSEPLDYAKHQAALIEEMFRGKLVEKLVQEGQGYQRVRRVFGALIGQYGRSLDYAARYVGGVEFHRSHKGDPNARPPFTVTPPDKQREALQFVTERAFSDKAFQFSPELLNSLAADRWDHWGTRTSEQSIEYPLHRIVLQTQTRLLDRLYDPRTLTRVLDNERRCPDDNCLTLPDVFNTTTSAIWSELDLKELPQGASNRSPVISSFRRGLQREHVKALIRILLNPPDGMPEDARTLAWAKLRKLEGDISQFLTRFPNVDEYTQAHLTESATRIKKALEAAYTQMR